MNNSPAVKFLYGTAPGRLILKFIIWSRAEKLVVLFLRSPLSRCVIPRYIKKNNIPVSQEEARTYRTFSDFFVRERSAGFQDTAPKHLVSPCDGLLSAFPVTEDSCFHIKGSVYRVEDLTGDTNLARNYRGGDCLIFRLCASDYHHYSYIDDGYQGKNNYIPGILHSVQPLACEKFPVYTLNRRCWCLMATENFGPVIQTEIGALVVGGISNFRENTRFRRGEEKGRFELSGSTIVLLFEKGRIRLAADLDSQVREGREVRVTQGMQIGSAVTGNMP